MKPACNRWNENFIVGFYLFVNHDTSNIPNLSNPTVNSSLASQTKCENMFSDLQSDHIFSHFLGTYLVYILFLLVCGNYPLTSKRERCRNLLSVDSRLNRIDPSTNIIFPPTAEREYRTKFEILLQVLFRIWLCILVLYFSGKYYLC